MPTAQPAFVITETNNPNLQYSCVLPIDMNTGSVVVDTQYCVINKGDANSVANDVEKFLRSAGITTIRVKK
jgi:hypothetical protein